MLSESEVTKFNEQGYLIGPRVLDDEQVVHLREEMDRVIRERDRQDIPHPVLCHNMGKSDAPVWQIVNIWEASDAFRRLISDGTIAQEIAQLTGASALRIWHDQIQYKPAGTGGVNMWHQDSPYWGILLPKDTMVTAWVALDDVDEDNGCMSMVPGSHQWGNQIQFLHTLKGFDEMPDEFQGNPVQVRACPVAKGHVHYHHALTWHGSNRNRSARPRRAIALHYMTEQTRYDAAGNHVMKQFVEVADGEIMQGSRFPVIWARPAARAPAGL